MSNVTIVINVKLDAADWLFITMCHWPVSHQSYCRLQQPYCSTSRTPIAASWTQWQHGDTGRPLSSQLSPPPTGCRRRRSNTETDNWRRRHCTNLWRIIHERSFKSRPNASISRQHCSQLSSIWTGGPCPFLSLVSRRSSCSTWWSIDAIRAGRNHIWTQWAWRRANSYCSLTKAAAAAAAACNTMN